MPTVPYSKRGSTVPGTNPQYRAPLKLSDTSPLQRRAASRAKSMFTEQRDDPKFKERFNEGMNPAISRSPEMDRLEQALKLADEIDKVHAAEFPRYSKEQQAQWMKTIADMKAKEAQ